MGALPPCPQGISNTGELFSLACTEIIRIPAISHAVMVVSEPICPTRRGRRPRSLVPSAIVAKRFWIVANEVPACELKAANLCQHLFSVHLPEVFLLRLSICYANGSCPSTLDPALPNHLWVCPTFSHTAIFTRSLRSLVPGHTGALSATFLSSSLLLCGRASARGECADAP